MLYSKDLYQFCVRNVLNLNFLFGPEVKVRSGYCEGHTSDSIKLAHVHDKITLVSTLVQ